MCNFSIPFTGDPTVLLQKARNTIESQKGTLEGDTNSGTFDVSILSNQIRGNYQVIGNVMNIEVIKKPFFVPCNTIENFLKGKIS
ncbi:hypothetical protein BH20BAC1_BH20BAC1_15650 [soil metagenome]